MASDNKPFSVRYSSVAAGNARCYVENATYSRGKKEIEALLIRVDVPVRQHSIELHQFAANAAVTYVSHLACITTKFSSGSRVLSRAVNAQ